MKNVHIRYEDCQGNFFSMGLTLEKLEIETINDNWDSEFIDRTLKENKVKPLQKKIHLCNIGFYGRQRDKKENLISLITDEEKQLQCFHDLFKSDEHMSTIYKDSYISQPLKCMTKLKQLSEQQIIQFRQRRYAVQGEAQGQILADSELREAQIEPIYQVHLDIEQVDVCILKSQFEAIFRIVEHLAEFQRFTDSFLSKRAIELKKFYEKKEDQDKTKDMYDQALLLQVRKQVRIFAFEGKKIPEE